MQLLTNKMEVAKIDFNYEELKKNLAEQTEKYTGLVVTEENIKDMIDTKNELGKLETAIDTFRKTNKKEMELPIKEFEDRCKELIAIIGNVRTPIVNQLNDFEEKRKEEKKLKIEKVIQDVKEKFNLDIKYASQLVLDNKYLNKTAKDTEILADLEQRATSLKQQQDNEKQLEEMKSQKLDLIQKEVERINQEYSLDMKISEFTHLQNAELADISKAIKERAAALYKVKQQEKAKALEEEIARADKFRKEEVSEANKVRNEEKTQTKPTPVTPKLFDFNLLVSECIADKAKQLKAWLEHNGYKYKLEVK